MWMLVLHRSSRFRSMRTRIDASLRLGLAAGLNGSSLPLAERFFAGGGTTIRSFEQDAIGPTESGPTIPMPRGGAATLILNNEIQFPIFNIVDGVGFLDAGNVYETVRDFDPFHLRSSAGSGIRVRTSYFMFRGDYGFNLNRKLGERLGTFSFSIGQAF